MFLKFCIAYFCLAETNYRILHNIISISAKSNDGTASWNSFSVLIGTHKYVMYFSTIKIC
jgi:hypothetical protein